MNIFFIKININFIIFYRYGGWSFGLFLIKDFRFDVIVVFVNRIFVKVSYDFFFGRLYRWECELGIFKYFYEVKIKFGYNECEK